MSTLAPRTSVGHGAPAVVECQQVVKTYPGDVRALTGVDITITPGQLTAVVGPSGSGKTTLLQIMGTLDRPTSGMVRVAGEDVTRLSDRALSRLRADRIGFVFQAFHLSPLLNVIDNVAEGLLYAGVGHRRRRELAAEALSTLGLGHRLTHRSHLLSGGEKQRAAIARAIVGSPDVLLADEPTGNLDTANGEIVVGLLRDFAHGGTAVVIITHDQEVAAQADTSVEIRDGRIVANRSEPD